MTDSPRKRWTAAANGKEGTEGKMKNMIRKAAPALMLCIGAFSAPVAAHASDGTDTEPPWVRAEASGGTLHIEAGDSGSGVDAVVVGGKRVNYRVDSSVDVRLADYADEGDKTVGVYASDFAGNRSETVEIGNPSYVQDTGAPGDGDLPGGMGASASADPGESAEDESEAAGMEDPAGTGGNPGGGNPLTPDGQASVTDNAGEDEGKEFYTFTTPDDNVFYLVIDRQRGSENVYFLNEVTESDLSTLAWKDTRPAEEAVPEPEACTCTEKCEAGLVNTACPLCKNDLSACTGIGQDGPEEEEAPEKTEAGGAGALIPILLAAAAAIGAGYYVKVYKPKHSFDDEGDMESMDGYGPEINEDADSPDGKSLYGDEGGIEDGGPGEAAESGYVYDDYPDDGPEQEG